jgi:hypothetical protein
MLQAADQGLVLASVVSLRNQCVLQSKTVTSRVENHSHVLGIALLQLLS